MAVSFKGFRQYKKAEFDKLSNAEKIGTISFVRDFDELGNLHGTSIFFGTREYTMATGELLPVIDVVPSIDDIPESIKVGDRYLVGTDETGYKIVIFGKGEDKLEIELGKYCVRVEKRYSKNYQYVNGKLITYDDVDCGTFDD